LGNSTDRKKLSSSIRNY